MGTHLTPALLGIIKSVLPVVITAFLGALVGYFFGRRIEREKLRNLHRDRAISAQFKAMQELHQIVTTFYDDLTMVGFPSLDLRREINLHAPYLTREVTHALDQFSEVINNVVMARAEEEPNPTMTKPFRDPRLTDAYFVVVRSILNEVKSSAAYGTLSEDEG